MTPVRKAKHRTGDKNPDAMILITGLSTRAIAESAARSGYQVITLDCFGDRDQRALVKNYSLLRDWRKPYSAQALLWASRDLDYDAVAYTSNLENHPHLVEQLSRGKTLLGNTPDVLRQVRDWRVVRTFCQEAGITSPRTILPGEEHSAHPAFTWISKPVSSGGGHNVTFWDGTRLRDGFILQEFVTGVPTSAVFAADARSSVLLGLTEQLIGKPELGGRGFSWCGNILPPALDPLHTPGVLDQVALMAEHLTRRFGLQGVNGIDLVLARGADARPRPYLIEVNPRYTGSMELLEWAYGLPIFAFHMEAMAGRLPDFELAPRFSGPYYAKGIVFAKHPVSVPETRDWMQRGRRDIPFPREKIDAGHPVCTVLAQGASRTTCWQELLARVDEVRREIGEINGELA